MKCLIMTLDVICKLFYCDYQSGCIWFKYSLIFCVLFNNVVLCVHVHMCDDGVLHLLAVMSLIYVRKRLRWLVVFSQTKTARHIFIKPPPTVFVPPYLPPRFVLSNSLVMGFLGCTSV